MLDLVQVLRKSNLICLLAILCIFLTSCSKTTYSLEEYNVYLFSTGLKADDNKDNRCKVKLSNSKLDNGVMVDYEYNGETYKGTTTDCKNSSCIIEWENKPIIHNNTKNEYISKNYLDYSKINKTKDRIHLHNCFISTEDNDYTYNERITLK